MRIIGKMNLSLQMTPDCSATYLNITRDFAYLEASQTGVLNLKNVVSSSFFIYIDKNTY
jgi:hypothetical protein